MTTKTSSSGDDETTETAAAAPEDEAQPTTFPVDFEEWAGGQPNFRHTAIAGFRSVVRKRGELRRMQSEAAWEQAFTTFMGSRGGEE